MHNKVLSGLGVGLTVIAVLALFGCSGGNSTPSGAAAEAVLVAQSFDEGCTLCHRSGAIVDVAAVHPQLANLNVTITGVTIPNAATTGGRPTVSFTVVNPQGIGVSGLTGFSFTVAKLIPGAGGDSSQWLSYVNRIEAKDPGEPGNFPDGTPTPVGTTVLQANVDNRGTLVDLSLTGGRFGDYTYTFAADLATVTDPISGAPMGYDPVLTHRISMETARGGPVGSAFFDFRPLDGETNKAVIDHRDVSATASCNDCHVQLAAHGEHRVTVEYCVTCHNPGTIDALSLNTVDFKVMIHKIHAGENLPSIAQNGWEYAIWGNANAKNDYSTVVHPQDIRNCTKCHEQTATTLDYLNWQTVPTIEACGSCHDLTSFTNPPPPGFTLHSGGAQIDNSLCAGCHPPTGGIAGITDSHLIPQQVASARFRFNLLGITNTGPGQFPQVTFSVTDPTTQSSYDILTHPAFTAAAGGVSRLAILIGWDTTDYTNTGSGSDPAQPISINPLSFGAGAIPATRNADGSFTVTSPIAIPAGVTGSGVVALEGHPAGDFDGDGVFRDRIPVKNAVLSFPITDTVARPRRTVVDINRCNGCHGVLSLHGNNRTDEIQVCVICHNPNATDIELRPVDPAAAPDGKVEEAIDFKSMIHAIHAGDIDDHGFRQNGLVIFGFGGSVNDFSEVRLPSRERNLTNCTGCHVGTTFMFPLNENVLPTTVRTGNDLADPDDDRNVTPGASVCSSCHDALPSRTHMSEQGGLFDFIAFAPAQPADGGGGEIELCGPGPISAQPAGHTDRLDCCSCHSFQ